MRITRQGQGSEFFTIAQIIVSGFGLLLALAGAGLLLLLGLAALFSEALDLASTASIFSMAWVSALVAALALPSLLYSFRRAQGAEPGPPETSRLRLASLLLMVWPLALVLGNLIAARGSLAWLLLPPLHLLAVGLPVWWLVEVARHQILAGSRQRAWGILNFSLLVTTPVVIVVEILVFVILLILFAVWLSSQPALVDAINNLAQSIVTSPPDPEVILELARPYLQNPLAIFSIFALLAGVVPLLEELLKPLALWTLAGRRMTPAEGFAAGALCGGAFALLESLLSLTGPMEGSWALLAVGRAGTALLHITTTALVGWAMAAAWQTGSYARLGLTYLLAASLHGLWNSLSVFSAMGILLENGPESLRFLASFGTVSPFALMFLVLILFLLLWGGNRRLRTTLQPAGPVLTGPENNDVPLSDL